MLGNGMSRNSTRCKSTQKIASAMVDAWLRAWHTVSPSTKVQFDASLKPSCRDTELIKDAEESRRCCWVGGLGRCQDGRCFRTRNGSRRRPKSSRGAWAATTAQCNLRPSA
eukprot:scaffold102089_cov78-Phaeocystis_antarctica.AAC.1